MKSNSAARRLFKLDWRTRNKKFYLAGFTVRDGVKSLRWFAVRSNAAKNNPELMRLRKRITRRWIVITKSWRGINGWTKRNLKEHARYMADVEVMEFLKAGALNEITVEEIDAVIHEELSCWGY